MRFRDLFSRLWPRQLAETEKLNFIDVGSGGPVPAPWDKERRRIDWLLKFEPRDESVSDSRTISVDCALWDSKGERDFYIYSGFKGTGSSLFLQNYAFVRENFDEISKEGPPELAETWLDRSQLVGVEKVLCRPLDDVLAGLRPRVRFDFMKIDAQGAEYQILQGAEKFLREDCQGLILELFRYPLYEGITLADDVIAWLDVAGFRLVKKMPPHGTFNSQNDCLFYRKDIRPEVEALLSQVYGL